MAIDAALGGLPEEFRVAVVLRDVCDLDYAEIADTLDIPVGTVKSRIARGRSLLAEPAREPDEPADRPTDTAAPTKRPTMADHDEFDASELASAYLDGEVSDDERAGSRATPRSSPKSNASGA